MSSQLCLTIRFLQPYFHGRGDGGEPEWPPSPLRMFQALVAAAATRWRHEGFQSSVVPALRWLERQRTTSIVASVGEPAEMKYRLYVPDNIADKVAKSWSAGREASIADYRTEKDIRPTYLRHGETVNYLYPLTENTCPHLEILIAAARSITHVGWGVDMVAGNAAVLSEEEVAALPGEHWHASSGRTGNGLRAPIAGTLDALIAKHEAFLHRIGPDGFNPVPPLSAFQMIDYRRNTEPPTRKFAPFVLLRPDGGAMRPFNPLRPHVLAGMVRHAAKCAAEMAGWPEDRVAGFILGHNDPPSANRFSYLPLPSIEYRANGNPGSAGVVTSIRRVLVAAALDAASDRVDWARRNLSGSDLIDEQDLLSTALLSALPNNDRNVQRYVGESTTWSTVTPVVLPGHDDRKSAKTETLLRKAIVQAGYSAALAERAILDWRPVGFWRGVELVSRYHVPPYLKNFSRHHVRIQWFDGRQSLKVSGPIAIGAGRHCGLGLFAAETA